MADGDLFAFHIGYNTIGSNVQGNVKPLYNGNIAETSWLTTSDNVLRRYSYKYDQLNRLKDAYYQKPNNVVLPTNSYNEHITYDKNGNIQTLIRNGASDSNVHAIEIDDLVYTYDSSEKNKLLKVTDNSNDRRGFADGFNTSDDYAYDANGNIIADSNKRLSFSYNYLNMLIQAVNTSNFSNPTVSYIYNAAGVKRAKKITRAPMWGEPGPVTTTTDYLEGFQYLEGELTFFPTAEGYVSNTYDYYTETWGFRYAFQYKDHLGNVRLSYEQNENGIAEILNENNYYPFGLEHTGYNMQTSEWLNYDAVKYKYNGKELQDELGLICMTMAVDIMTQRLVEG